MGRDHVSLRFLQAPCIIWPPMGLEDKMTPEMETTHKDLYNGLWDCPESFHMEVNKYILFVKIIKT